VINEHIEWDFNKVSAKLRRFPQNKNELSEVEIWQDFEIAEFIVINEHIEWGFNDVSGSSDVLNPTKNEHLSGALTKSQQDSGVLPSKIEGG